MWNIDRNYAMEWYLSLARNSTNTFENSESIFLCTDNRATQRRKGKKLKSRFSHKQEHEDPDIQIEIVRHGSDNVRII